VKISRFVAALAALWPGPATPELFAPGVISTGHEFTLTFTADGREVYFTRYSLEPRWNHIMHSVLKEGAWQPAERVSFSSDAWADLDPSLSPDGKRLYFVSTRPRPSGTGPARNMDIWYADREGDHWGAPHWIEGINSDGKEGSPTMDRHGTLCFFSDRDRAANSNAIYCAAPLEKNGSRWAQPVLLNANVNAGPSDTSPWLSPDGNTLLFYSNRTGGFGKSDLYVSVKRGDWQPAQNLGPVVNTAETEYNPSVSPDGKSLYFGRNGNVYVLPLSSLDSTIARTSMFK
jgi:dipeptidyl aminopeptidase/acylaminoacyl peptidase